MNPSATPSVNHTSTLIKGVGIIFFVGMVTSALAYLLRLILARRLTPDELGLFFAIYSVILLVGWTKSFGLGSALSKFVPEYLILKDYSKIKSMLVFILSFTLLSSILVLLIAYLVPASFINGYFKSELAKPLLLLLLIFLFIDAIVQLLSSYFLSVKFFFLYSLRDLLTKGIVVGALLLFSGFSLTEVAFLYIGSSVINLAIHLFFFFKHFPFFSSKVSLSAQTMRRWFRFSLPMTFRDLFDVLMTYTDNLILVFFRPLAEVAMYNVILPTADLLLVVGRPFGRIMFPLTSELVALHDRQKLLFLLGKSHKYVFLLLVPLAVVVILFSKFILTTFFGVDYTGGALALQILTIGYLFPCLSLISYNVLLGLGRSKEAAGVTIAVNILNLVLNLLLIPFFGNFGQGYLGAIIATAIGSFISFFSFSWFLYKFLQYKPPWKELFVTLMVGVGFLAGGYYLQGMTANVLLQIIFVALLLLLYPPTLFLFRITSLKEMKGFWDIFVRRIKV